MQPGSRRRRAAQCLHLESGSGPAHALQLSLPTRLREAESSALRTVHAPAAALPLPLQPTDSLYNSGRLGPGERPPRLPPAGGHLSAKGVSHLFFTTAAYCHKRGGVRGIPSGSQILHGYPYNLPSHALQHIVFTGHLDIKEQACSEPKKRKGGWPKGKKRKPPKEFSAPRAPTTGYVIFLNEQRIKTKATHPDLPFTEITKMLAAQWSQLSQAEKQKYIKEAEKDKQRYMKELKAYQDSEAYQAFLERRAVHKVKTLCGTISIGSRSENEALALSTVDRDESNDLYCRTCNQFFSSFHNKKEHLMGKQHLQNLTGEFEKETAEFSKHQKLQEEKEEKDESEEEIDSTDVFQFGGLTFQKNFASSDFCSLQEFIFRLLKFKEFELCELKRSLTKAYEEQESLKKQLEDLKQHMHKTI
ncbi:high mobility group protein 20A-like isoform X7 [Gopherus flavomarginatus]|uniref:high mobility group protein 20A-like isoform X7 n=1 Tax=Gopherus flavomarginatus TaxID=286002 RepID=UPI0021CBD280|nr:high mobility group protein 20A-like isoform X7 [Gopherus flavomarginatus]XP_050803711.1 high mobility group protein 20A-like isoform X7 [Gopherus flavomarginatus]